MTLAESLSGEVYGVLLVFTRVAAAFSMFPGFGEMAVPMRARLAAALAVALALSVVVPGLPDLPPAAPAQLLRDVVGEAAAGGVIGVVARIFFAALQIAGQIIGQVTSLSAIYVVPGAGFEGGSVAGTFLMIGGLVVVFMADVHHLAIRALLDSYSLMPATQIPDPMGLAKLTTEAVAQSFRLAVQLSAPLLVIGFVYNLGLGLINRAMPQLAVFFVGLPVSILGGLVVLSFGIAAMVTLFIQSYAAYLTGLMR